MTSSDSGLPRKHNWTDTFAVDVAAPPSLADDHFWFLTKSWSSHHIERVCVCVSYHHHFLCFLHLRYQQILHRNIVYLATIADASPDMPAAVTNVHTLHCHQLPQWCCLTRDSRCHLGLLPAQRAVGLCGSCQPSWWKLSPHGHFNTVPLLFPVCLHVFQWERKNFSIQWSIWLLQL